MFKTEFECLCINEQPDKHEFRQHDLRRNIAEKIEKINR